jgi:transposase
VPTWSMAPVVEAYRARRGVSGVAVTLEGEIGYVRRFDNPRQLMAFSAWFPRSAPALKQFAVLA